MANALQVISQAGPLPIQQTVQIESDAPVLILISASAWTQIPNSPIGVALLVDGVQVAQATLFCNATAQHMALVAPAAPYTPTIGAHTFTLQASTSQTVSDLNDTYSVTLLY